ncbi:MAG: ATP-binding domain-containing protein, partial [Proteobacteria bacterium]|nr:ATP-binding domain-containing protein [Pseudomonadota bacterium]
LKPTGIRYVPVAHEGCSQKSEEEAAIVLDLYRDLLKQRFTDRKGGNHAVTAENILVVAPYNMQVNLLKRTLSQGARVGTVDKFQGQEAEAVIISMATSSGEDLPRHIEFLYSKNRLNVAISRARCLVILVANPALMTIRCTTPEQMALVNTLCWVRDYDV